MNFLKALVSVILIVLPALFFGYQGNSSTMALAILAGSIAATFINLDKFQEFSGWVFGARLKEAVKEAELTVVQMKKIIEPLVVGSIHQLIYRRRPGVAHERDHSLYEDMKKLASELKIDNNRDVIDVFTDYLRLQAYDLFRNIYAPKSTICKNCLTFHEEITALFNFEIDGFCPDADEIEAVFRQHGTDLTCDQKIALAEYAFYLRQYPQLLKFSDGK